VTRLPLLVPAAVLLGLPTAPAADTAPTPRSVAAKPGGEPIDVLYLSDARPVVVRFRVASDDRPLAEGWDKFVGAVFTLLDADKDGSLDTKELAKVRPAVALLTGRTGLPQPPNSPRGGKAGEMTREGLADYLQRAGLEPFRVPAGADPATRVRQPRIVRGGSVITTEELDKGLIDLLDTDKDGKLSAAELAAGPDALGPLDGDENELLTPEEVLRRPPPLPFFVQQIDDGTTGPAAELALLPRKGADQNLARRLLFRYCTPPQAANTARSFSRTTPVRPAQPAQPAKRRLTQKDIKVTPEVFDALDQDGDGELDSEELARFGENAAPEIEIALRFGKRPAGTQSIAVVVPGRDPVRAFGVSGGSEAALEVPGVRLDLLTGQDRPSNTVRLQYRNRFQIQDRDANGYLEVTELGQDPLLRELFPFLDRDGDGKVFEKEYNAALDEVEPVALAAERAMVSTELTEAGRGLFGLIDTDADGRLSPRELRGMPALIDRFDRDTDGLLSAGEVPRRFRVTFSRGLVVAANPFGPVAVPLRMDGQPTPRPKVGPTWFQKMDRNQDGDVSPREFLGTDADFRRIDADGDGLIDAREAAAGTAGR
jgi:Ca2+-binding EF-hand superfamily protein